LEVGEDAVRLATPELPLTLSEAALPLRSRDKMIGALTVQSDRPGTFDQDAITVLQTMADLVATALDNARLFQQAQEAAEAERRTLGELSRQAWQQTLRARPDLGVLSNAQATVPAGNLWRPEMKTALRTGEMVTTDPANTVAIPIKVRGQVIGVVGGRKPGDSGQWTAEEIALMQTLTEQLSTALESARLHQDTQRRAARERLTREITDNIRAAISVEDAVQRAVREMSRALGAEMVARIGTEQELLSAERGDGHE
jgi:GAF domain-containing protein